MPNLPLTPEQIEDLRDLPQSKRGPWVQNLIDLAESLDVDPSKARTVFFYHFKCTVCVDLRLGKTNMANSPEPPMDPRMYQRILHVYGPFESDQHINNGDYYQYCVEELITPQARRTAHEHYGIAMESLEEAVIIVDSINLLGHRLQQIEE